MKPASLSEGRRGPAQIWNSAPQLAQIPAINPSSLVPRGARVVVIAPIRVTRYWPAGACCNCSAPLNTPCC